MKRKTLPSKSVLNDILRYERRTGELYWKPRATKYFSDKGNGANYVAKRWNTRNANKKCAPSVNSGGYLIVYIFDTPYQAHRVIWKMIKGVEPDIVDHKDRNKKNNLIGNLRSADTNSNLRNKSKYKNNTSKMTGVRKMKDSGKWMARINVQGESIYLGLFTKFEDAKSARIKANKRYGFSKTHGQ